MAAVDEAPPKKTKFDPADAERCLKKWKEDGQYAAFFEEVLGDSEDAHHLFCNQLVVQCITCPEVQLTATRYIKNLMKHVDSNRLYTT